MLISYGIYNGLIYLTIEMGYNGNVMVMQWDKCNDYNGPLILQHPFATPIATRVEINCFNQLLVLLVFSVAAARSHC